MHARLILACTALFVVERQAQAELVIAEPVARLGTIKGGMPLACSFRLHNAGKQAVEVIDIERGCGCLTPRLEKRLLAPGEQASLHFDLRTLGHKDGAHTWHARVRYREAAAVREAALAVHAVVTNDVTLEPSALALFVEKSLRQEVLVVDRRPTPLAITRVEVTHRSIKATLLEQSKGAYKIVLEANGATVVPGRYDEMLNIYTSDPLYAHLQAPITLVRAATTAVLVTPEMVRLGPGETTALIRLRPRGANPLVIDKAAADDPAITCTWASNPEHGGVVKLQVDLKRVDGKSTIVRIHVRDMAEALLVPVEILKD